jgi:hypothetical protein
MRSALLLLDGTHHTRGALVGVVIGYDQQGVNQAGDVEEQAQDQVQEGLDGLPAEQHGQGRQEDGNEVEHGGLRLKGVVEAAHFIRSILRSRRCHFKGPEAQEEVCLRGVSCFLSGAGCVNLPPGFALPIVSGPRTMLDCTPKETTS